VLLSHFFHKMLKNLVSTRALLSRIHHSQQIFLIPVLSHELSPLGFVCDFTTGYFFSQKLTIVDSVDSIPESSLLSLLLFPLLLCIKNIIQESADSIIRMQIFVALVIFIHYPNIVPLGIVFYIVVFQRLSESVTVLSFQL